MKRRFIIEIHDGIDPSTALQQVAEVLDAGPISTTAGRPHSCHLTTFSDGSQVWCHLNQKSERFLVMKKQQP